jgi:hypothetical protein
MADIFVSYTNSDRDWAFWIAKELEALDHTPHIHEWEIEGGEDIYAWMEARLQAADHVLCVVSDEYLRAAYSTLERNAALWQAAKDRPGFVLLVVVKPCRLPALSDQLRRCELFGIPEGAARLRCRAFMSRPSVPDSAAFPGKVFAVSNVPIGIPRHFMGRAEPLAEIETALKRYEGRVAIMALHGLRGVGKTVLAAAYADLHRGDYRATWWIRAQSEPGMRADLVALGMRLGWMPPDEKEEPGLAAVMERLRHEGEGILLIFDNATDADALKPYLPRGGAARVLVTSNARAWRGIAEPVEIRLWPKEIGADFLVARTDRAVEREAAEDLSEALGGLPLAHEQAAAYCERLGIPLAEYRRRFAAAPVQMLDTPRDAPAEYHDKLTVAKTFALAIDEAAKLHPAAELLIVHAALLAPEPIPLFVFAEAREELAEPLASALAEEGLDEAVAALRTFALVDRETIVDERDPAISTDTIRLHRLVREVAAGRREGQARENARRALVVALAAVYPRGVFNDPKTWPRARRLDGLALAQVSGDTMPPKGAEIPASYLLNLLASYRHGALGPMLRRGLSSSARLRSARRRSAPTIQVMGGTSTISPACVRSRAISPRRGRSMSAPWRSPRKHSALAIPIPHYALTTSRPCFRTRVISPRHDRSSSARWRSARRCSAPSIPISPYASITSRTCSAPRVISPQRDRSSSARWRSTIRRLAPTILIARGPSTTSPSCFRHGANSPRRGHSTSARWRSTRRGSAQTIPIPRMCGTTSPPSFGALGHENQCVPDCATLEDPTTQRPPFDISCSAAAFSARPAGEPTSDRSTPQKICRGRADRLRRRSGVNFSCQV